MTSAQTSIHITVPHGKKLSHKSKIGGAVFRAPNVL